MQRCSPSITEFQMNWFHDHYSAWWDLLLFHDQLCVNKEEPTDLSLKKLTTRKKSQKTLLLTYAFPNLAFLLEAFLPDTLGTQPLPPKENVSKERCRSVSLTWSHQTKWGDVQGSHWIKGHCHCMGIKKRSKLQWGPQKYSTKEDLQNLACRSISREFFWEPSQTQVLALHCSCSPTQTPASAVANSLLTFHTILLGRI